jgi:hypothetical protein
LITVAVDGLTTTAATGTGATVRMELPVFPSLVAVIVADPAECAVTSPLPSTVAIASLLEDQVIGRPVRGLLFASRVDAIACVDCPASIDDAARDTVTLATGTRVTESVLVSDLPALLAVMCAVPGACAVMSPVVWFTEAN